MRGVEAAGRGMVEGGIEPSLAILARLQHPPGVLPGPKSGGSGSPFVGAPRGSGQRQNEEPDRRVRRRASGRAEATGA